MTGASITSPALLIQEQGGPGSHWDAKQNVPDSTVGPVNGI